MFIALRPGRGPGGTTLSSESGMFWAQMKSNTRAGFVMTFGSVTKRLSEGSQWVPRGRLPRFTGCSRGQPERKLTRRDNEFQVEVCREFQRGQCTRSDQECKFAHPPPHVDVQQGRVTACYDSIKVRSRREETFSNFGVVNTMRCA